VPLLSRSKLSLVLRPSELLLALPKSNQKARHRTRCFDSHRANQNPLRFSARRGGSDSTSMYCFAIAAIHRRDPAGTFPSRLRCSAPRTAPFIHESVHPWTASRQCVGAQERAAVGAPVVRRGCGGKLEEWRARCAPVRCMYMDVHSTNPVAPSRTRRAGCPESAPPGCVSIGDFSLHKQRKVTRSPEVASGSSASSNVPTDASS